MIKTTGIINFAEYQGPNEGTVQLYIDDYLNQIKKIVDKEIRIIIEVIER